MNDRDASPVLSIAPEPPDTPDAIRLIGELDNCLNALYAPENRHGLSIAALQEDPSIVFLVARRGGQAVGCGAVRFVTDEDVPYAEIKRMYVPPAWRGLGIARVVLERLEKWAAQKGVGVVRLETGVFQQEAVRLYERAGFVRRPPFGKYRDSDVNLWYEKRVECGDD